LIYCQIHVGQFRDTKHPNLEDKETTDFAQKLGAHTNATINIFERGLLTDGETVVEVENSQLGFKKVHSLLPVCGAIVGAVLACIESKGG